jgi:anti-sigma regulatory factor (Ser/Thr protein kinase)
VNERLIVCNLLPEVENFQRRLEDLLRGAGYSDDLVHDLSLVSEEVLVNIVHYGYEGGEGQGDREIRIWLRAGEDRKVHLEVRDDARPFDPLLVEERDPDDERLGGWGIPMLKTLTDHVEYAREGGENVLRMIRGERDS